MITKTIFWKTARQARWRWLIDPVYNILFIALTYLGFQAVNQLTKKTGILDMLQQQTELIAIMGQQTQEEAVKLMTQISHTLAALALMVLALIAYIIISYAVTEYFIYKNVYSRKFSAKTLIKYALFSIIILILISAIVLLLMQIIKPAAAAIMLLLAILITIYFFTAFNQLYFREGKVFRAIKLVYFATITKFHRLLAAFGWMILTLVILATVFSAVYLLIPTNWIFIIPTLAWLTFGRYYLKNVFESKNFRDLFKR